MATITLGWIASAGAVGYKIHYGTVPATYTVVQDAGNPVTKEKDVPGLLLNTMYYFAMGAYNSLGEESTLSAEVSGSVSEPIPAPPTGLAIVATSPNG